MRIAAITKRYRQSTRRIFFLDYDGTLADYAPTPEQATPTNAIRTVLQALSKDLHNHLVIVSGRDCVTLDNWFGDLPLAFAAEHGSFIKEKGEQWHKQSKRNDTWKTTIHPLMDIASKELSGSFVEEKQTALVWHYRRSDPAKAHPVVTKLAHQLQPLTDKLQLALMPGHKIVEVKEADSSKDAAATYWLNHHDWEFVLAAGDDTTDEALFQAMPKQAFSIKIGAGQSCASYRLNTPHELISLLQDLSEL